MLKRKYKFDNSNTLLLLADNKKISKREGDLQKIDKFLGKLKNNKREYARLVFFIAVFMNKNSIVFADSMGAELGSTASQLIDLLLDFAKYGCIFMGGKTMLEHMLHGANLKQATTEGLQYFLFYLLLQFYPKLFTMIKF